MAVAKKKAAKKKVAKKAVKKTAKKAVKKKATGYRRKEEGNGGDITTKDRL